MRDFGRDFRSAYIENGRIWMRFSSFDARDITDAVEPVIQQRTEHLQREADQLRAELAELRRRVGHG